MKDKPEITLAVNAESFTEKLRIISRHLLNMADELEDADRMLDDENAVSKYYESRRKYK